MTFIGPARASFRERRIRCASADNETVVYLAAKALKAVRLTSGAESPIDTLYHAA